MADNKRSSPKIGFPLILVIAVVAAGLGLLVARRGSPPPLDVSKPPPSTLPGRKPTADTTTTTTTTKTTKPTAPVEPLPEPATREDEEKIYAWLTGYDDTNQVAEAILAGWPKLSEGGRTAAAPHLLNLVPDERFDAVSEILMDPKTNNDVKGILFAGVLNRSDAVKWPLILKVMEQKNHPHSQDARNMLSVVLGGDFGEDWEKWRNLVTTRLVNQTPP